MSSYEAAIAMKAAIKLKLKQDNLPEKKDRFPGRLGVTLLLWSWFVASGVLDEAGGTIKVVEDILHEPDSIEGDCSRSETMVVMLPSPSSAVWLTWTEQSTPDSSI